MDEQAPKVWPPKPPLGNRPALGPTYSVFTIRTLDEEAEYEREWVGRFQDVSFDGFETEAQALRWVLRRMDGAYRAALRYIAEVEHQLVRQKDEIDELRQHIEVPLLQTLDIFTNPADETGTREFVERLIRARALANGPNQAGTDSSVSAQATGGG